MRAIKYFFYLSAIIFPFGQITSFTLPDYPDIRIHLLDISVAITSFSYLIYHFRQKLPRSLHVLSKKMIVFIVVAGFSLLYNVSKYDTPQLIIGSLYLTRFIAYFLLYPSIKALFKDRPLIIARIRVILIGVGVVSAGIGLIQFFLYPNLRNLQYLGWDPHHNRAFGALLDPQFLGIILVVTLIFLITQIEQKYTNSANVSHQQWLSVERSRAIYLFAAGVVFIALILTFSRSSYLAFLAGIGVLGFVKGPERSGKSTNLGRLGILGITTGLVIIVSVIFSSGNIGMNLLRTETAYSRVKSWREGIEVWKKSPLIGIGFNTYRYFRRSEKLTPDGLPSKTPGVVRKETKAERSGAGIDNSLLFILATTGILGLATYLNIWSAIIRLIREDVYCYKKYAIFTALFTHAMFNNTLFYPWVMWWMWVYIGYSTQLQKNRQ